MPIRVEPSIDDPIITFTFEAPLDPETTQAAKRQTAQLLTEMGTFYGIVDLRGVEMTGDEAVALLESPDVAALSADPRVSFVFVGRTVLDNSTNQSGSSVFASVEAALEYLHREIAESALGQPSSDAHE